MLRGRLCTVRPWNQSDMDSLVRHANNVNIAKQLRDRFPHPYSRENAVAFLKHIGRDTEPTSFAIVVEGEAAGGIGFEPGTDVERYSAEIGYWLGERYWGRGIVSEALTLVTSDAFDRFNILRLFALPFADNAASRRVLEKAGYVCEGIMQRSSVKYGVPRDQALYAKINSGWKGISPLS